MEMNKMAYQSKWSNLGASDDVAPTSPPTTLRNTKYNNKYTNSIILVSQDENSHKGIQLYIQ